MRRVLPLGSLLPPHHAADADRCDNDDARQVSTVEHVGNRGQGDDCLSQSHVEPKGAFLAGALEVDCLQLVGEQVVVGQHHVLPHWSAIASAMP